MMFDKGQPQTIIIPQMNSSGGNALLPAIFPISVAPILIPTQPSINISTTLTPTVFPANVAAISLPSHVTLSHGAQDNPGRIPATTNAGHLHIQTQSIGTQPHTNNILSPFIPINVTVQPQVINFSAAPSLYIKTEPKEVVSFSSQNNRKGAVGVSQNHVEVTKQNGGSISAHSNLKDLVQLFDQSHEKKHSISQVFNSGRNGSCEAPKVKPEPADNNVIFKQSVNSNNILDQRDHAHIVQRETNNCPQYMTSESLSNCYLTEVSNFNGSHADASTSPGSCPTPSFSSESTSPEAPDTSALTTLAIVCDNLGSGRDRQYVVKVQLEEPTATAATRTPKKNKHQKSHQKQKDKSKSQCESVREPVPKKVNLAELALAASSDDEVDVSRLSEEEIPPDVKRATPRTPDIELAKSHIKRLPFRKKKADRTSSKLREKINNFDNVNVKKDVHRDSKTSSKKSKSQEESSPASTKPKKKGGKNDLPLPMIAGKSRGQRIRANEFQKRIKRNTRRKNTSSTSTDGEGCLDDVLRNLNGSSDSAHVDQTQTVANMSPASTIPYGEDSNDSVDLSGRSMYQCTKCIKSYTSERRLRLHIGLIHQDSDKSPLSSIFSCKQCTKAYTSQKRLDLHVLLVHEQHSKYGPAAPSPSSQKRKHGPELEIKIEEETAAENSNHNVSEISQGGSTVVSGGAGSTSCYLCGKKYSTSERLNLHMALIHGTGKMFHYNVKATGHSSKKIKKESGINGTPTETLVKIRIKKEPGEVEDAPVRMKRPQFSCSGCTLVFTDKHLYQEHLPMHDQEKKLNLKKVNNRTFIKKYYLSNDGSMHRIQCCVCSGNFIDERTGADHVRNIHGIYDSKDQRLPCRYCGKIFTKKQFLTRHLNVHIGISSIANQVKKYQCSDCPKHFTQKAHLARHVQLKHVDADLVRVFKCDICSRSFKLKAHLKRHILLHQGNLPFKCSICPTACADRNSLRNHIRVHTGERPFDCPHCDHAFALKNNLNNHIINIHPEKLDPKTARKHQCVICGKICHKGGLKLHIKSHDTEKTHKCELCPCMYKSRFQKLVHMRRVHKHHQWFYCEQCGKECKSRQALNKHMEKH